MEGWISVDRRIFKNWVWSEKPFSFGQAWIDLILQANHKENKFPLGGEIITIERGSFVTSELKLMDRWGWSKSKVRRFLKLLEDDFMIIKNSDRKKTTITIVNYSVYQDTETEKEPVETHKKPRKKTEKTFDENSPEYLLASLLESRIRKNDSGFKEQNLQKWAVYIDYLIRLDERDPKLIQDVIIFSQTDNFWKTNILSTEKLRDKFSQLMLKMEEKNTPKTPQKKSSNQFLDQAKKEGIL